MIWEFIRDNGQTWVIICFSIVAILGIIAFLIYPFGAFVNKPGKSTPVYALYTDGSFKLEGPIAGKIVRAMYENGNLVLYPAAGVTKATCSVAFYDGKSFSKTKMFNVQFAQGPAVLPTANTGTVTGVAIAFKGNGDKTPSTFIKGAAGKRVAWAILILVTFVIPVLLFALFYASWFIFDYVDSSLYVEGMSPLPTYYMPAFLIAAVGLIPAIVAAVTNWLFTEKI